MSKDIKGIGNDALAQFLTPEQVKPESKKVEIKETRGTNNKLKNNTNKLANYTITFKIDADVEDYLKNILWINRKTRTEYVNELIRDDMKSLLKVKPNANDNELLKAWEDYKKANNI